MELKKNKKYELQPKRPFHFGIGMVIALSLTLVAFEWRSPVDPLVILDGDDLPDWEMPIIPPTVIDPPLPPKAVKIEPVKIDVPEPIDRPPVDVGITPGDEIEVPLPIIEDEEPVDEAPKNWAEVMPAFEGGMSNFYKYMGKHIKYPKRAKQLGVEGRVFLQFVVEKDGSLSDIRVIKGIGAGCDEEALRVMQNLPNFIPGKQGDVRVRVQMVVPINFVLH